MIACSSATSPKCWVVCEGDYDTEATTMLDLKCLFGAGVSGAERC